MTRPPGIFRAQVCPGSYPSRFGFWVLLNDVVKMKDSKGNILTIGDRVKVLWNFDNKIHEGHIFRIRENVAEMRLSEKYLKSA